MSAHEGVLIFEEPGAPRFEGLLFGAAPGSYSEDRGYGEMVFNTSMTGYQEILTDPSYYGQIICMTTAHIGNTGVNLEDPESRRAWCAGFIVNDLSEKHSNWRAKGSLDEYLKHWGIPGLCKVDTRALTRYLRSRGVQRALIVRKGEEANASEWFKKLPTFEGRDLIREVTTQKPYSWPEKGVSPGPAPSGALKKAYKKVVAVDFGVKWNLLRELERRGCEIEVVPATAGAEEILSRKPDGVFLSNGPGDPSAAPYAVESVKQLVGKVPLFGVCMGHQILGLAMGGKTYKMKFGHRGGNQPVLDHSTGKVEISSHNHGYAVEEKAFPSDVKVTHINLNDKTVEGLEVKGRYAFSVQYHPEACPGPHDSEGLFDRFMDLMAEFKGGRAK
jgi:carbamoyl-phosphate synthase small subunit